MGNTVLALVYKRKRNGEIGREKGEREEGEKRRKRGKY